MAATAEELVKIDSLLAKCQSEIRLGEFTQSIRTCKSAIHLLGSSYEYPGLIDDTGQKLLLAETKENEGDLQAASGLYVSVLESRVSAAHSKQSVSDANP